MVNRQTGRRSSWKASAVRRLWRNQLALPTTATPPRAPNQQSNVPQVPRWTYLFAGRPSLSERFAAIQTHTFDPSRPQCPRRPTGQRSRTGQRLPAVSVFSSSCLCVVLRTTSISPALCGCPTRSTVSERRLLTRQDLPQNRTRERQFLHSSEVDESCTDA